MCGEEELSIIDFQQLMRTLYGERDKQRGIEKTFLWLISEIGELAEAIRIDDQNGIKEEMADVLAWLCSVANLYNINLDEAVEKKYPSNCPRCLKSPCNCAIQ